MQLSLRVQMVRMGIMGSSHVVGAVVLVKVRDHVEEVPSLAEGPDGQNGNASVGGASIVV